MEKLIELLNEYNEGGHWRDENFDKNKLLVISKHYGFIQWLVENDKIEFREDFYLEDQHGGGFGEDENIIMLLSIQDNPIDFLISILK